MWLIVCPMADSGTVELFLTNIHFDLLQVLFSVLF